MKEIDIIKRLYDLRNDELYEDEDYEFIAFVKSFLEDKNISTDKKKWQVDQFNKSK